MTRDDLIEVMAREILKRELLAPYEGMLTSEVPLMEINAVVNMGWRARRSFAYAALAAIEAAGVRLVPGTLTKDMCMACMYSDQAATGVDRIDYHAVLHRRYAAQLAASPYAPAQKDESHE